MKENPLLQLEHFGQSIWMDFIRHAPGRQFQRIPRRVSSLGQALRRLIHKEVRP